MSSVVLAYNSCLHDPDIIALTEILPKHYRYEVQKVELNLQGYTLHCEAKPDHRAICMYTKANLKASLCEKLTNSDFKESLWVNINISRGQHLLVGCVYRSPSSIQENNILLSLLINQSLETKPTHLLIMGDMNYSDINWDLRSSQKAQDEVSGEFLFLKALDDLYLHQHCREPRRIREGQRATLDDLIITQEETEITELEYLSPLGKSDRVVLSFKYMLKGNYVESPVEQLNYYKADYPAIQKGLRTIEWKQLFEERNSKRVTISSLTSYQN